MACKTCGGAIESLSSLPTRLPCLSITEDTDSPADRYGARFWRAEGVTPHILTLVLKGRIIQANVDGGHVLVGKTFTYILSVLNVQFSNETKDR